MQRTSCNFKSEVTSVNVYGKWKAAGRPMDKKIYYKLVTEKHKIYKHILQSINMGHNAYKT